MARLFRLAAAAALIGLGGCLSYSEAPSRPAPVVVAPAPATGTVVVQPAQ